jgi:hypothetical protein
MIQTPQVILQLMPVEVLEQEELAKVGEMDGNEFFWLLFWFISVIIAESPTSGKAGGLEM